MARFISSRQILLFSTRGWALKITKQNFALEKFSSFSSMNHRRASAQAHGFVE